MGVRTAPAVDGTPTYYTVRLRWIDAKQDIRSDSYRIEISTDALVEAFAAAMSTASNASLYEVDVSANYVGARLASNATDAVHVAVGDNIVMQMKEPSGRAVDLFLPAAEGTLFNPVASESPDPTATDLSDITAAFNALKTLVYTAIQYRFTERRDKNPAVKL